jgi:hypothetical protein
LIFDTREVIRFIEVNSKNPIHEAKVNQKVSFFYGGKTKECSVNKIGIEIKEQIL